jgi:hypothetical protein
MPETWYVKALATDFLSDVGRAIERAGLPAKRWRKQYDNGGGESFFFGQFARLRRSPVWLSW